MSSIAVCMRMSGSNSKRLPRRRLSLASLRVSPSCPFSGENLGSFLGETRGPKNSTILGRIEGGNPPGLNRLRKKGRFPPQLARWASAGAKAQSDSIGFIGTTEVVPCYKASRDEVFLQPIKPTMIQLAFCGG